MVGPAEWPGRPLIALLTDLLISRVTKFTFPIIFVTSPHLSFTLTAASSVALRAKKDEGPRKGKCMRCWWWGSLCCCCCCLPCFLLACCQSIDTSALRANTGALACGWWVVVAHGHCCQRLAGLLLSIDGLLFFTNTSALRANAGHLGWTIAAAIV